jgi:hypothetical protein
MYSAKLPRLFDEESFHPRIHGIDTSFLPHGLHRHHIGDVDLHGGGLLDEMHADH